MLALLLPLLSLANETCVYGTGPDGVKLELAIKVAERMQFVPCQELAVGKSRVIDVPDDQSPTGVEHRYKLTRTKNNEFEVALNLRFHDARSDSEGEKGQFDQTLHNWAKTHTQACLSHAAPALIGPGGARLKIRLTDEQEPNPKAPLVDVNIGPGNMRANSRAHRENIDCPTLLHELLHLMGLADEYEETDSGYVVDKVTGEIKWAAEKAEHFAYDCRAITEEKSVMHYHSHAYHAAYGKEYPPELTLCRCSNAACRTLLSRGMLRSFNDKGCPLGSKEINGPPSQTQSNVARYTKSGVYADDVSHGFFTVARGIEARPGVSLLKPAHFSAITAPGCRANFGYYQCAIEAYRTSKVNKGEGCLFEPRHRSCVKGDGRHWVPRKGEDNSDKKDRAGKKNKEGQ